MLKDIFGITIMSRWMQAIFFAWDNNCYPIFETESHNFSSGESERRNDVRIGAKDSLSITDVIYVWVVPQIMSPYDLDHLLQYQLGPPHLYSSQHEPP